MSKIKLYCRPKCETCKGMSAMSGKNWKGDCKTCNGKGYTDSVMEFEEGVMFLDGGTTYNLLINNNFIVSIEHRNKMGDYIENAILYINPTHLEVIEVKECPKCEGNGSIIQKGSDKVFGEISGFAEKCYDCNETGTTKVVTQFTVFRSKGKYDEALTKKVEAKYRTYECYGCHDEFLIDSNRMEEILDRNYTLCRDCIKKKAPDEETSLPGGQTGG